MSVSFYGYNKTTQSFSEAEVNLSNLNASGLLDLLGVQVGEDFSERCCGSMSADDLLGRVLIAQAINPADEGLPVYKMTGAEAGPSIWFGGRSAGYFDERLAQVRELAEEVKALGDDWVINWA